MVSFWPWSANSNSPASFEKTLSTLSASITDTQARLEKTRVRARRRKALATLYLSLAYVVYIVVLLVAVGYQNFGLYEWIGTTGGPVLIYVARNVVSTYYAFRIDSYETRLKSQQDERAKTIQKLKDATKYDSTLELIEKYGGEGKKKKKDDGDGDRPKKQKQPQHRPGRTSMPPPPTANIQRGAQPASHPSSPHPQQQQQQQQQQPGTPQGQPANSLEPTEEFAPNAFSGSSPPQPSAGYTAMSLVPESHWYDRVFDVLLGEDESASKNRIVLICSSCRLVNGQAPPGTTSLAQVGMWRCMACHATNNEENETKKLIEEALADAYEEEEGDAEVKDEQDEDEADTSGVMVEADGEEGSTGLDKGSARKRNTKK